MHASEIYTLLAQVPDPEIPVINIVELGIVRNVMKEGDEFIIQITPTYSGCPAMHVIELDIASLLHSKGIHNFKIQMIYSPAWTTGWMSAEAKEKLRAYGIAPPNQQVEQRTTALLDDQEIEVQCPHCRSMRTHKTSEFGSTACKALYKCDNCLEPFDYFKCI